MSPHTCDPEARLPFGSYCPMCGEPQDTIYGISNAAWRKAYDLGFKAGKAQAAIGDQKIA